MFDFSLLFLIFTKKKKVFAHLVFLKQNFLHVLKFFIDLLGVINIQLLRTIKSYFFKIIIF